MRKGLFLSVSSTVFVLLLMLAGCRPSATEQGESSATVMPTQLDVESFIDGIDLTQDISQLSLSDCYILRHAFAARKGYPFKDAFLRGVYLTTSWYDSLMYVFDEDESYFNHNVPYDGNQSWRENYYLQIVEGAVTLTDEEQAFVARLKAREDSLLQHNFDVPEGLRVNMANLLNGSQLNDFAPQLQQKLAENGFAIVPANHQQLFHIYEQNDYTNMPNFVTTDLFLQLYHHYFDCMLRDVEQHRFFALLNNFCKEAQKETVRVVVAGEESDSPKAWLNTYFDVAQALLDGRQPASGDAIDEYQRVMKSEDAFSPYLGYHDVKFGYSLFRPRGHYTRNDTLQRYFRTMMWLQTVPFRTDRKEDMQRAATLAAIVGNSSTLTNLYKQITEPMTWLMGQPDDVSILQVADVLKTSTDFDDMVRKVDEIAEKQTRIRPKYLRTGSNKVRLMPQRYQPDAEVLQEMVDYESEPSTRPLPQGLDVMAAMGVGTAEKLLHEEGQRWKDFQPTLDRMKARMDSIDWTETTATQWLSALKTLNDSASDTPYFMHTHAWERKSLNSSLAAWAQLKHDAILYAKQPMGAECGGGGPPDPIVKGYVEPNIAFWQKAVELLSGTKNLLKRYNLLTAKTSEGTDHIREMAQMLLNFSEKELRGELLTDTEYDQLEYIGAAFENLSLEMLREPDQWLMGWDDVQGPDRNTALVADVYTANADNNPEKSILYAAVGQADEIYVIVEVGGYLHLMRGAVLSYREFSRPLGEQRLNDEEWQEQLKSNERHGVPQWMAPITVPLKKQPKPNEKYFYSTGC